MGYERYSAKRTYYHGTWFRSNLEARVAQALTALGIAWEYERQCFRDERFPHDQYTPDFHLPNSGAYVEVCPALDERHRANVSVLCELLGSTRDEPRVVVVDGSGDITGHWVAGGRLRGRRARWRGKGGGEVGNIFDAAGMKRW